MDIQGTLSGGLLEVGECTHRTVSATQNRQQITLTPGKRTIEMRNTGTKTVYFGGTGVTIAGFPIYRREWRSFINVKDDWSIYVICASGETTTLSIVEYD